MGRKEDMRDDTVRAYEDATGQLPDTRDYVAIENAVEKWDSEQGEE